MPRRKVAQASGGGHLRQKRHEKKGGEMKKYFRAGVMAGVVVFAAAAVAMAADEQKTHKGGDTTPKAAYEMMQKDPQHTFLVDIRSGYEYQDIGHPVGSYNIPFKFYTTEINEKGYKMVANPNFCSDLKARFKPETDTLLLLCRSGHRSVEATTAAVECGFEKSYNVLTGFEGDKVKDKDAPNFGKRMVSGWRIDGLPWTYDMDQSLMYAPDVKAAAQK